MIRWNWLTILAMCLAGILSPLALADDPRSADAIASGLAYLARQQNLDGSFASDRSRFSDTGLALLAFLSTGNTSDGGRYAANVRRAVDFLVRQAPADRNFGVADDSGATGQSIVTLALCEAYGVESEDATRMRIRSVAKDALTIVAAGNDTTDWRAAAQHEATQIGLRTPVPHAAATAADASHRPATTRALAAPDLAALSASAAEDLLSLQLPDGSWPGVADADAPSRLRQTARAVFLLSRPLAMIPLPDK